VSNVGQVRRDGREPSAKSTATTVNRAQRPPVGDRDGVVDVLTRGYVIDWDCHIAQLGQLDIECRQGEAHTCTRRWRAEPDLASVGMHNRVRDREPETCPLARACGVPPAKEGLERVLMVCRPEARAVIEDLHLDRVPPAAHA
jgi:hypothetical protein